MTIDTNKALRNHINQMNALRNEIFNHDNVSSDLFLVSENLHSNVKEEVKEVKEVKEVNHLTSSVMGWIEKTYNKDKFEREKRLQKERMDKYRKIIFGDNDDDLENFIL